LVPRRRRGSIAESVLAQVQRELPEVASFRQDIENTQLHVIAQAGM
jgi:hypothetical protein